MQTITIVITLGIYALGLIFIGFPLMLLALLGSRVANSDHWVATCLLSRLILMFWPVVLWWYRVEKKSITEEDPDEDHYIFYHYDSDDD